MQITSAKQPAKTWNDVIAEYELNPPVPPAAENRELVNAMIRSLELTKATQAIYSALQRGTLEGHARHNGSGDVERIAPAVWTRLKIQGIAGHDIAVPIDVKDEPLPLLRSVEDFLSGSVPADLKPTVWVDPEFSAEAAVRLWPAAYATDSASQAHWRQQRPFEAAKATMDDERSRPEPKPGDQVMTATGAPGRPSSMHLLDPEFKRRRDSNRCELSISAESKVLHAWLRENYPQAPLPTPRTIETRIRRDYNRWKTNDLTSAKNC